MNLNQSNQRPVGRGALLRRLAEHNASSASTTDESRSCTPTSTSNDSLLDSSNISSPELDFITKESLNDSGHSSRASTGRGQLLQRILLANASISNDAFKLEEAPKPYGTGRGRMLKMLSESSRQAERTVEESIASVDDAVESLSIGSAEEDPVIKRGTRG